MDGAAGRVDQQYRLAVEEYRFQVDLNWRRSEYFFVLNIGVLVAAASLLASQDLPRALVAFIFGLGALLACLSIFANNTQHGYYRSARELKQKLEDKLELEGLALQTTPGMGSTIERWGRVRTFLRIMLVAIALVDIVGAGISTHAALADDPHPPDTVRVVIRVADMNGQLTAVISQGNQVIAARAIVPDRQAKPLTLAPGKYEASILGRSLCVKKIEVTPAPLQLARIACGGA
jgi:hypothetical protein